MKKKYIIFSIIFIIIISIAIIINDNKYLKIKGYPNTLIMVTYNGQEQDSFPLKDNSLYYDIDVSCSNADGSWDYENWKLLIQNLDTTAKCSVNITSSPKDTLYNKIVTDWNKTDGTNNIYKEVHDYDGDNNPDYYEYRYEGKDTEVNNYVWFNNELWRIIGAFPGGTPSTGSGTTFIRGNAAPSVNNTVKIIRNESIGSYVWDKDGYSNWNNAELNTNILNNLYLNSASGTCNIYKTTITKPCSFETNGLKNVADFIETVTWNLGGYDALGNSTVPNPTDMYVYERGTTVYSGRPYVTTAKVGLMYPSDYGYGVASDSCQTDTDLLRYYSNSCAGSSWLLRYGYEWTNSPSSSNSYHCFYLFTYSNVSYNSCNLNYNARPVVHLNNNVNVYGGDGSINNPFVISL